MTDFIKKLQAKPYETRLKIMWSSVLVVGVLLIVVFVFNIKNTVKGIDGKNLINIKETTPTTETTATYATVERMEQSQTSTKIYFNFNNSTDDILNISKLENISLTADGAETKPTGITDRQGAPFVQKILSHTQVFGVLVLPGVNGTSGVLRFDRMFFEKDQNNIFQQKIDLNFDQLNKNPGVRN